MLGWGGEGDIYHVILFKNVVFKQGEHHGGGDDVFPATGVYR